MKRSRAVQTEGRAQVIIVWGVSEESGKVDDFPETATARCSKRQRVRARYCCDGWMQR